MKRFIAVILAIIYMSTAMGATVQLHYCMGKLVSWELGSSIKDHCKGCGMKLPAKNTSKKKCCQDEYKEIKLKKDHHNPAAAGVMVSIALEATPVTMYTLQVMPVASLAVSFPVAQAPPNLGNTPVFLRNCNFRI